MAIAITAMCGCGISEFNAVRKSKRAINRSTDTIKKVDQTIEKAAKDTALVLGKTIDSATNTEEKVLALSKSIEQYLQSIDQRLKSNEEKIANCIDKIDDFDNKIETVEQLQILIRYLKETKQRMDQQARIMASSQKRIEINSDQINEEDD